MSYLPDQPQERKTPSIPATPAALAEASGDFAPPAGTIQTNTKITLDGIGLKTGFDGARQFGCSGFSFYGKGFISVLFGEFNSSYTQVNNTTTVVQANSNWSDQRVVPILEYELGINWTSVSGRLNCSKVWVAPKCRASNCSTASKCSSPKRLKAGRVSRNTLVASNSRKISRGAKPAA